jgi:hypothetical protein
MLPGMSNWRVPTPHEVFACFVIVCEALRASPDVCPPSSSCGHVLSVLATAFAIAGISSARQYLSPRVRSILDQNDHKENGK